jgi:hypothetical protein
MLLASPQGQGQGQEQGEGEGEGEETEKEKGGGCMSSNLHKAFINNNTTCTAGGMQRQGGGMLLSRWNTLVEAYQCGICLDLLAAPKVCVCRIYIHDSLLPTYITYRDSGKDSEMLMWDD